MYPRLPGIADAAILRELQGMNASHDFIFAFGHRARCERRGEKRPKMPMRRWLVVVLLICIAATSLGCRSMMIFMARRISEPAATSPPVDIAVERDIVFAETPDGPLALDVYTLVDRPAAPLPVKGPFAAAHFGAGSLAAQGATAPPARAARRRERRRAPWPARRT